MTAQSFPCSASAREDFLRQFSRNLERQVSYVAFAVVVAVVGCHCNIAGHSMVATENAVVAAVVVVGHLCQVASLSVCLANQEQVPHRWTLGLEGRYSALLLLLGWRPCSHPRTPRPPSW